MTVPLRSGHIIPAASLAPEPWRALSLQNGWVARGGFYTPSYRKEPGGLVRLTGGMIGGTNTNGTVIAVLPPGYRPASDHPMEMLGNDGRVIGLFARTTGDLEIFRSADSDTAFALYLMGAIPLAV